VAHVSLESDLSLRSGSAFFATFDFSNGYWQLPVVSETTEVHSFMTPDVVFTANRVLHGHQLATHNPLLPKIIA
jgi:hypothetical protein